MKIEILVLLHSQREKTIELFINGTNGTQSFSCNTLKVLVLKTSNFSDLSVFAQILMSDQNEPFADSLSRRMNEFESIFHPRDQQEPHLDHL